MQTARDITASPPGRPMLHVLAKCWWLLWHRRHPFWPARVHLAGTDRGR